MTPARTSAHVWGVTAEEAAAPFPCDELGFAHDDVYLRGVTVRAPVPDVFRWLCQLRVAPYSYDWLDNFGRRSPPYLTPGLESLAIGQRVMTIFRLAAFEPGTSLTIVPGRFYPAWLFGNIAGTYRVTPSSTGTRLTAKVLVRYPRGPLGSVAVVTLPHADLFMFRKQLDTLRRYAERDAGGRTSEGRPAPL